MSGHMLPKVAKVILPLSSKLHKGQSGRVGVVGGSRDYTGAPFFSSYTAMLFGADLGHVICEPTAGTVIKTYSPDIIVHRIIDPDRPLKEFSKELEGLISRLHTLIIGPGLGRESYMLDAARETIRQARLKDMYIVLDADGLYLVQNDPSVIKGYPKAILTPNVVEFKRLCDAVGVNSNAKHDTLAPSLSKALGNVTIIQKGGTDIIAKADMVEKVSEPGSLKRCGGQGDLLTGILATFLCWAKTYEEEPSLFPKDDRLDTNELTVIAAYGACTSTRTAARLAFEEKKRSMQSSDMLRYVGHAYDTLWGPKGRSSL